MECNKEEAERCKAISEGNFKRHDLVGAKKFALKARQLFPELEGLPQLFSILDVHIAAHQKLRSGESNCYGILQVDFRADDNTIRKQYRKLALVLHPDKNKAFGAEAAFKHISEAWSVLSDRDKKLGYDKRWREHMLACATRFQNPDTLRSSRVSMSRVNINKSPNVNWAHQGQAHVHPQQGAHVHRQQGQYHARVCQQAHGQGHAHQQHWQGHARVPRGQGQGQANVPRQQGQGQANAPQQRGQGQTHASPLQGQGLIHTPQQKERDHACAHQQQGQSQGHVHQQQGQGQLYVDQGQGQGQAHGHEQQGQGQVHVRNQQGWGPVHAHQQQGQQAQGQAHQAPIPQKHDAHEHQVHGQVHVHQHQGHAHQNQMQDTMQAQGQPHQVSVPPKNHAHEHQVQDHVHVHQQQWHGPVDAHQQQGQDGTQAQGQAHQAPVPQNHRDGVNQVHVSKPSQPASQHNKSTFWTVCPSCRMQLEYERAHTNKNLCCPMCYKAFVSKEIAPVQGTVLWPPSVLQSKTDLKTDAGMKSDLFDSNFDRIPRADSTLPSMVHSYKKAKIGVEDNLPRQHEHQKLPEAPAQPAQKPVELCKKGLGRLGKDELKKRVALHAKEGLERLIGRSRGVIVQKLSEEKERKAAADKASAMGQNQKANNERSALATGRFAQNKSVAAEKEGCVHYMEEKANDADECNSRAWTGNLTEVCKKDRVSLESYDFVKSRPAGTGISKVEALHRKRKLASPMDKSVEDPSEGASNSIKEFKSYRGCKDRAVSNERSFRVDDVDESADKCMMEVPDADFHNFDGDRTEDHFTSGQIWASYDDDDGMPRYYGRVNKILSLQPLKMQMNWLEARNPSDETLAWLDSGFQHSCGDFKLGSMYIAEEVSTFSHLMAVDKGLKGGFKIYPRQGDVWAVYKDWEILKVKKDKRGYDMVEIAAAFDEEKGLQVSPLFKVAGFKTIFERKAGEDHVKWIPPQELRRLSHQVPAHRIVAGEVPRIQVDCLELDPASVPLNLIYGKQ